MEHRETIGIDEIIKDCFAVPGAGIHEKRMRSASGWRICLPARRAPLGKRQTFGEKGGVLVQAAPLDKGPFHRADALQGLFAEGTVQRFALAFLLQAALLICLVEDGLQVGFGEIANAQRAANRKNIVFPVLPGTRSGRKCRPYRTDHPASRRRAWTPWWTC